MVKKIITLSILFLTFLFSCDDNNPSKNIDPKPIGQIIIQQDSILLNPYGCTPLSALLKVTSPNKSKVKITVFGKNGSLSNIEHTFSEFSTNHEIPVLGLYANYNNTVKISLLDANNNITDTTSINIQTGNLPANLPASITSVISKPESMEPGLNVVSNYSTSSPRIPYIVDAFGEIRWVLDYKDNPLMQKLSYDCGIARLRNGNFYFGDKTNHKIYEIDILGKIINVWDFPGYGFHHHVYEKPDGNFLVAVDKAGSVNIKGDPTVEDYIIEISRQTGAIIYEWDLKESLDETRKALTANTSDWIHVNAVIYDPSDNTIIISGRTQGVIKLDYNNKVKWIISTHLGWGMNRKEEDLNQFLLHPLDLNGNKINEKQVLDGFQNHNDFEWCWFQHSPEIMPNGDLLLFDNGTARLYDSSEISTKYSRAVVYRINSKDMTIQQVWQYGKERGVETYSSIVSRVQYLPQTDHILFSPGFYVTDSKGGFGGRTVEVDYKTKEVVFELTATAPNNWGWHRVDRMNLYP